MFSCAWLSQKFESSIWKPLKFCIFWYETQLEERRAEVCIRGHKSEKTVKKHGKIIENGFSRVFCWSFSFLIPKHEAKWIAYSNSAPKTVWIPKTFYEKKFFCFSLKNHRREPRQLAKRNKTEGEYREFSKKNKKIFFHEKS